MLVLIFDAFAQKKRCFKNFNFVWVFTQKRRNRKKNIKNVSRLKAFWATFFKKSSSVTSLQT
jgi:hypothetical protein